MFLNRENEITRIKEVLQAHKTTAKSILIYGLRRVGKSTLIKTALSGFDGIVISYIAVEDTYESNLKQLSACAAEALGMPALSSVSDIDSLMSFIAGTGRKTVIVLDEYSLMKEAFRDGNLDSYFQRIIDKSNDSITFIFCGSYLSSMKKMSQYKEPLYGRFDLEIHLKPFDYLDSAAFYPGLSPYEKIQYYAVFGGFPFILERLQPDKGLIWNMQRSFLDSWDAVYSTVNEILLTEISKLEYASAILAYLRNGKARNSEIASAINASSSSVSKELLRLMDMDLIRKNNPINRASDAKKTFYEISDNLFRFFYTYVLPNRNYIMHYGAEASFDNLINQSLDTYVSKRFEDIVKEYITRLIRERRQRDYLTVGTYWYDLPKEGKNGEFDCVIEMKGGYAIIECKYLKEPMQLQLAVKEEQQAKEIQEFKIRNFGFACPSGFDFENSNGWILFSGDDLYSR